MLIPKTLCPHENTIITHDPDFDRVQDHGRLSDEYIFMHLLFCWFELFRSRSVACCACVQAFAFLLVLKLSIVLWVVCVRVVVVAVDVAVCVRIALKKASVCTFKTLPCVLSKRLCHMGHGRFKKYTRERLERTLGSVLKVVAPSLSLSSRVSLLSCVSFSLSLSPSDHLSFFLFSLDNRSQQQCQ